MTRDELIERVAEAIGYNLAAIVSGNNMPEMSGDPRRRIPPGRRRHFDDACLEAARAAYPIIQDAVLEEAAKIADANAHEDCQVAEQIALAIRVCRPVDEKVRGISEAEAFELVAQWHDKNARYCLDASRDDPRLAPEDRRRAYEAHRHHAASAAAIRNRLITSRRRALESEDGDG